jgi:hypothetical protein
MHKSAQTSVTTLTEEMSALIAAVTPEDCKCCGDGASGGNATDGNSSGANSTRAEEDEWGKEAEATQRRRHRQTYAASRRAEGKDEMKAVLEELLRTDTHGQSTTLKSGRGGRKGRGKVKEGEGDEGEKEEEDEEDEQVFALDESTTMADAAAPWRLWLSYRLKRDLMPLKRDLLQLKRDQRRLWRSYRRENASSDANTSTANTENTSGGACSCQAQCKGRRRGGGGGDAGSDGTGGEGDGEEHWVSGEEAGALAMLPEEAGEDGGEGGGRRGGADAMAIAPTMNLSEALVEISQLGSLVESLAPRLEKALAIFGTIPRYKLDVRGSITTSRSSFTQPSNRAKTPKRNSRENAEMVEGGGGREREKESLLATNLHKKGRGRGASKEEEEEEVRDTRGALTTSAQLTQQARAPLEDIFLGVTAAHRALSGLPSINLAGWASGTRSWAAGSFSTWYRALASVALIVLFSVLLCASLLACNIAAVSCGRLDSAHHRWVYVGSAVMSAIAWLLLGVVYPLSIVLGGICSAIPSSGAEDNLQLVRVLVPPKMLPMTRRLVDSCLPRLSSPSSSTTTSAGTSGVGGSDGRWTGGKDDNIVGRAYMLDVVGLNVELVNATFDAFQLDKQVSFLSSPKLNLNAV